MRLTISHSTSYRFDAPMPYGLQQVRLRPKSRAGQRVQTWSVAVDGGRVEAEFQDHHANHVALLSFEPGTERLDVMCMGTVETEDRAGVVGLHGGFTPLWLFQRSTPLTRAGPNVRSLAKGLRDAHDSDLALLHDLSARVLAAVPYELGHTDAQTTADEAIQRGRGVCQDHAHVFISCARAIGIPARYVSGYLLMEGQSQQDATHAWAEAHVEGLGWVGFDVSNEICPDARYVRVATGLDYREAAPVSGLRFGDGVEALDVTIQVQQQ